MSNERPKKLQRISQACDLCHRRSIRCRPSNENPQQQCQNCYDFAVECTYKRPSRRRRNPSIAQTSPPNILPSQQGGQVISPTSSGQSQEFANGAQPLSITNGVHNADVRVFGNVRDGSQDDVLGIAWRSFAMASLGTIEQYLEIYMDVVYPIYPLFHGPTLRNRIRQRHHLVDRGFFASVMAACSLAAARVRDGAINADKYQFVETPERSSEIFFNAAQDAIFKDLNKAQGLSYLRACALLALTSIQHGQIKQMHQYLGHYLTLLAMQQFYDEACWPANISIVEREERRRLFWSMYQLDVYTSVVFGCIMKSQETHSNVRYPSEVNDEDLLNGLGSPANEDNWLRGWNFTIDLYRVLEHSIKRMRRIRSARDDRISIIRLLISDGIPESQVMESVWGLYYALPPRFKDYTQQPTGNKEQDFLGFQAANIQATLQLVRMTLFSTSLTYDVTQKCNVAEQVLHTFHGIAPQYLRAISTPLVYHLGGIGQILASVMEGLLCEESYQRVRGLLVSMADLLQGLESGLQPTGGASVGLRRQIEKIDRYMEAQRQLMPSVPQAQSHMGGHDGTANGYLPQANIAGVNGLRIQTPLDEFQLPPDLVHDGAWPWPFDFTHEHQVPVMTAFE